MRRFGVPVALVTSIIIACLALEAGWRAFSYYTVRTKILLAASAQFPNDPAGTSTFDPEIGYRYRPNITVARSDGPFPVYWTTNSHGHIARSDYPVAKPADEYRIALVGDSMTANVTNTIRWGDVLEDRLNASPRWRAAVGGRTTRVLNFALDGIGTIQFGAVVNNLVAPFSIDLLLVNLIIPDVARRPYFRGSSSAMSRDEFTSIILNRSVNKLPWFELYPETLAVAAGRWIGLEPRLTLAKATALLNTERHFRDAHEAANKSAVIAKEIAVKYPKALWLEHPLYSAYVGEDNPNDPETRLFRESYDAFRQKTPEIDIVRMINLLPKPQSRAEADSWYNVPHDQHNSDKGLRLYGEGVADLIIQRVAR